MKIYKKHIYVGLAVVTVVILAIIFLSKNQGSNPPDIEAKMEDGVQIIEVDAQSGGYSPRSIQAKAGVPAKLKITSTNSYGCESAFRIPTLGVSKSLPSQGVTEIDIPAQDPGKKVVGTCSMGMYSFTINFK